MIANDYAFLLYLVYRTGHAPSADSRMLEHNGFIRVRANSGDGEWVLTEKGECLVQHILSLPLPVEDRKWVMPEVSRG